jgi:hypothetical protein
MPEVDKVAGALWASFVEHTERPEGRGIFLRVGDEKERVRAVLYAVAKMITPVLFEVARLRKEVKRITDENIL